MRFADEPTGDERREGFPAVIFRALFQKWRPHGFMRLGTWMARLFPSMQDVSLPYHGTWISLDLRKIDQQTTFLDGAAEYEAEEQRLIEHLVPVGGTAIDIGANIGLYTITLARLVGPKGVVISYEPQVDTLLKNTAAFPQVIVRPFAVADAERDVMFRRDRSSSLSRVVSNSEGRRRDSITRSVTLDAECSRLHLGTIDFIKIDIEGGEANALRGARQLMSESLAPVILFEWIPGFRTRSTESVFAVLEDCVGQGWRLFRVGWNRPIAEIHDFKAPEEEANIIAFPPNRSHALHRFLQSSGLASSSAGARPQVPLAVNQ